MECKLEKFTSKLPLFRERGRKKLLKFETLSKSFCSHRATLLLCKMTLACSVISNEMDLKKPEFFFSKNQ
jgi:hypothetical protein